MKIDIVTTGDEVMQGVIVDTNTAWIAERCHALGHEVVRHTSVGDDAEAIGEALKAASRRAGAVIVTGGLGPTADDITVEAAAGAFGVRLVRDEAVLEEIRTFFQRTGRPMSASNEKQALIPQGGKVLPNRVGTAPGIQVRLGDAECFFLPGVPKELYQIFDDAVMPWLSQNARGAMAERVLCCFGIPEAAIDERLRGVDLGGARLSFRVKFPEILLKVVGRAEGVAEARSIADAAAAAIRRRLGDVVYGEGETTLAAVALRMLADRGMTLAVAESCTGGLIASTVTDVPGSSAVFERGVVCYSNRSKRELLGVTEELLRAHGAVSRECAMAMAEGVRRTSGAAVGVAVTGIAGPGGGTPEKPVGTVHVALATLEGTEEHDYHFPRDRIWFKQLAAWTALDVVRKYLFNSGFGTRDSGLGPLVPESPIPNSGSRNV